MNTIEEQADLGAPTERTDMPEQDPGEPPPGESRRHMIRRRVLTLLTIVLLIGVPAGYLVVSANQSRDSGRDAQARYAATGLTAGAPSHALRRLYQLPLPTEREAVSYYETNNWKTSRLYVEFLTTQHGLEEFLTGTGTSVGALRQGYLPISARDRRVAGWDFTGTGDWRGLAHYQHRPHPSQKIVVNFANPRYPQVYVVSSTTP